MEAAEETAQTHTICKYDNTQVGKANRLEGEKGEEMDLMTKLYF